MTAPSGPPPLTVHHEPERAWFVARDADGGTGVPPGEAPARLTYTLSGPAERTGGPAVRLEHTVVPPALGGQGLAGRLAAAALDWARAEDLAVVPVCVFVQGYLAKHPEAAEGLRLLEP